MGKTKNYRLSEDEKRIHRESMLAEYKAVFDEFIYPIFESTDESFSGCPDDFRQCLKAVDYVANTIGDYKADGFFRDTGAKRVFLQKLNEIPGIGKSIMKKIEGGCDRWEITMIS